MAYPTPSGLSLVSNPAAQTHEQLTDEVADLRARLAEVSDTLDAIRGGEVDAVLVQGPQSSQLFTLKGADDPYRVLIEEMNQGAVTLSADGSILYCNRRFADLLKMPLEEIIGLSFDAFVAPSERAGFAALLEAGRTGGSAGEITLRAGDASAVPLQLALGPLPAESAAAICLVATDISERKRAEDALRASEERYRTLFESNPNPMWVYDLETLSFLGVNPTAVRHYGYSQEEFLTMTIKDIRPSEDISALMDDLSQGTDDLNNSNQWRHRKKNGALIDVEITSHELTWLGRRAKLVLINDITKRKQAEERLREQAKLLYLAQDAIMVRDMEDRVEFWNHGAEKLYGWTAAEVQGKKASSFLYRDQPAATAAARAAVIENGDWTGECKHSCKDGGAVMVRSRWTLVRDELAAPKSILIINTDVTEQKKLETQLLRAQRLESIGTLASGVAHDLNNILTPILMCAEVLKGGPSREDFPALVSLIEESARRGANVVKQVFTFARGVEGERVVIKPSHLIQEMIDIAQKTFPKTIEILGRYTDDLWSIKCRSE